METAKTPDVIRTKTLRTPRKKIVSISSEVALLVETFFFVFLLSSSFGTHAQTSARVTWKCDYSICRSNKVLHPMRDKGKTATRKRKT